MYELARAYPDTTISVKEIAERQSISPKYLESIISTLKAAGLIRSFRGFEGGYCLARPPDRIRMIEIFRALEGSPSLVECVDDPELCDLCDACPTRSLWGRITDAVSAVLEGLTLQELANSSPEASGLHVNRHCDKKNPLKA